MARTEECVLEDETGPAEAVPPPPSAAFVVEMWQRGLQPRPRILWINLAALVIVGIWAGMMWVAPFTVDEGQLRDLDGLVGLRDHDETFQDLNPMAKFIYEQGDSQCHQKDSRTLILNGNEMPFCARDVAIYTFMALGVALSVFPRMPYYDRVNDLKWYWMVGALVPIGVDGLGQLAGYWESTNPMRLLTGGLCGLVVGLALGFLLREVSAMMQQARADAKDR